MPVWGLLSAFQDVQSDAQRHFYLKTLQPLLVQ